MQGRRVYPDENGHIKYAEGDYGINPQDGKWYARPPGHHTGCLAEHDVTEHEDGTITVSPSILIEGGGKDKGWHGYLERGVWREC